MTLVFIDGAHGTTGLEIAERLAGRPGLNLISLDDERRKDTEARRDAINAADVVILCLPDDAARESVALIDNDRTRVIDASTAHRTDLAWTFGLPELVGRDVVAASKRVSNPGCYSTGFIALVAPLVKAGLLPSDWPYVCNAVSGYSGGGKAMIAEFEGGTAATAWRTYALSLSHKHVPEMQVRCGLQYPPLFSPSVAATHRGMIVEVPLMTSAMPGKPSADALRAALAEAYEASPVVHVIDGLEDANLMIERCAGTDRLELFVFGRADDAQVRLVAALDNLGKGAGGAAVQSLNLMAGLPETSGLRL
jgi:N-acetyl-gamma-glutamyl-phosphate reductase